MEMSSLAPNCAQENIRSGVFVTPLSPLRCPGRAPEGVAPIASRHHDGWWPTVLVTVHLRQPHNRPLRGIWPNRSREPPMLPFPSQRLEVGVTPRRALFLPPRESPPTGGQRTPAGGPGGMGRFPLGNPGTNGRSASAEQGPESTQDGPERVREEIHSRQSRTGSRKTVVT